MTTASATDFKANISAFLRRAVEGEEVMITSRGKVKARLVPEQHSTTGGLEFLTKAKALRIRLAKSLCQDEWKVADYLRESRRS